MRRHIILTILWMVWLDGTFAADGISSNFTTVEVTGLAPGFQYELRPSADGKTLALAALNDGVAASVAEPPRLSITRFGPQIVVECASPTPGFILQASTLGTPGNRSNLATNEHRLSFSPDSQYNSSEWSSLNSRLDSTPLTRSPLSIPSVRFLLTTETNRPRSFRLAHQKRHHSSSSLDA